MKPEVTILLPNYKTPELTCLCLRLLRKYTDPKRIRVICIDNNSQDASLEYLRHLNWIQLIERPPAEDDTPALSHGRALDLALEYVDTPYVLSMHTDTFVKSPEWLPKLLAAIQSDDHIAGVGSWKLESVSRVKHLLKSLEAIFQLFWHRLRRCLGLSCKQRDHSRFLRSHLALYRTDLLRQLPTRFADPNQCAGKAIHQQLEALGYRMVFLNEQRLLEYVEHFNHATMVLNPELGAGDRACRKGLKRIEAGLKKLNADVILQDRALDV